MHRADRSPGIFLVTSEPVPGFSTPSSTRIALKIKPYFLQLLKNLAVVENKCAADTVYKKESTQGMAQL